MPTVYSVCACVCVYSFVYKSIWRCLFLAIVCRYVHDDDDQKQQLERHGRDDNLDDGDAVDCCMGAGNSDILCDGSKRRAVN